MNETTELLKVLADKLGTTSEYLWGVLLSQAPISATVNLLLLLLAIVGWVVFYRAHKYLSKEIPDNRYRYTRYQENDAAPVIMIIAGVVLVVYSLIMICSIESIVAGYFNPEYWALNKVLRVVQ
jgi:uncharacterized membrane protein